MGLTNYSFWCVSALLAGNKCMLMSLGQTCNTHHLAVENLPDVKGYATSDLWVLHPTKPDFWKMFNISCSYLD